MQVEITSIRPSDSGKVILTPFRLLTDDDLLPIVLYIRRIDSVTTDDVSIYFMALLHMRSHRAKTSVI